MAAGTGAAWPADWSTLVPDLIVAVVTGLLIGLVLWLLQLIYERRRNADVARRISLRIVQPLLLVLQAPSYVLSFTDMSALPRKHQAAFNIIENSDLDEWHETRPTKLTRSLMSYRSVLRDYQQDANDLAQAVERWFNVHEADPRVRQWVAGKLLGANIEVLRDSSNGKTDYQDLVRDGERVLEQRLVSKHARAFRTAQRRADNAVGRLLPILIEHIRRQNPKSDRRKQSRRR